MRYITLLVLVCALLGCGNASATHRTPYAAAVDSPVFHRSDCQYMREMLPQNVRWFEARQEAAQDRRPCERCRP